MFWKVIAIIGVAELVFLCAAVGACADYMKDVASAIIERRS